MRKSSLNYCHLIILRENTILLVKLLSLSFFFLLPPSKLFAAIVKSISQPIHNPSPMRLRDQQRSIERCFNLMGSIELKRQSGSDSHNLSLGVERPSLLADQMQKNHLEANKHCVATDNSLITQAGKEEERMANECLKKGSDKMQEPDSRENNQGDEDSPKVHPDDRKKTSDELQGPKYYALLSYR